MAGFRSALLLQVGCHICCPHTDHCRTDLLKGLSDHLERVEQAGENHGCRALLIIMLTAMQAQAEAVARLTMSRAQVEAAARRAISSAREATHLLMREGIIALPGLEVGGKALSLARTEVMEKKDPL